MALKKVSKKDTKELSKSSKALKKAEEKEEVKDTEKVEKKDENTVKSVKIDTKDVPHTGRPHYFITAPENGGTTLFVILHKDDKAVVAMDRDYTTITVPTEQFDKGIWEYAKGKKVELKAYKLKETK
jgi:hypothetical protein